MSQQKNENLRYIGKVKNSDLVNKSTGESFSKQSLLISNPDSVDKNGANNPFYKGSLLWFDTQTGKYYKIKRIDFAGVSQRDQENGFAHSLKIDLDNPYNVEELKD